MGGLIVSANFVDLVTSAQVIAALGFYILCAMQSQK
jgi:hypothetical protein